MRAELPNLELIEYKALQIIREEWGESEPIDFYTYTFPQAWSRTCGGLDVMPDGEPAGGQMRMKEEYTTVVCEACTDTYLVFFGNRYAYKKERPNKNFFHDFNERSMAPLSKATDRYK